MCRAIECVISTVGNDELGSGESKVRGQEFLSPVDLLVLYTNLEGLSLCCV